MDDGPRRSVYDFELGGQRCTTWGFRLGEVPAFSTQSILARVPGNNNKGMLKQSMPKLDFMTSI